MDLLDTKRPSNLEMRTMQWKRRRRLRILAVPVMLSYWLVAIVHTVSGDLIPRAMTSSDLLDYGRRLNLSSAQLEALDRAFFGYLDQVRELRRDALQARSGIGGVVERMPAEVPTRAEVRRFLSQQQRLLGRMGEIDNGFFSQIAPILTEEQSVLLERVRLHRKRSRYASNLLVAQWFANRRQADLGELVDSLQLTPAERIAALPTVVAYENALTGAIERLWEGARELRLRWIKRTEQEGGDPIEIWGEEAAAVQPLASSIPALNREWCPRLQSVLPAEAARELRTRYYHQVQPHVYPGGSKVVLHHIELSLALAGLAEEQREAIEGVAAGYRDKWEDLADRLIEAWDERLNRLPRRIGTEVVIEIGGTVEENNRQVDELMRLEAEHRDLETSTETHLEQLLGEALTKVKNERLKKRRNSKAKEPSREDDTNLLPPRIRVEMLLPEPIDESELQRHASALELDEEHYTILRALFADYSDQFRASVQQRRREIRELHIGFAFRPTPDERGWNNAYSPAVDVERAFMILNVALRAIREIEETFFSDIEQAVLADEQSEEMYRWRLAFARNIYAQRPAVYPFLASSGGAKKGLTSHVDRVDFIGLVDAMNLSDGERAVVDEVLRETADDVNAGLRRAEATSNDAWRANALWLSALRGIVPGDKATVLLLAAKQRSAVRESRTQRQALVLLSYGLVDKIANVLSKSLADQVQRTFNKRAYPSVYVDPGAVRAMLERARSVDGLSPFQRHELDELSIEYSRDYETCCTEMVAIIKEYELKEPGQAGRALLREELEMVAQRREHVNAAAKRRLGRILTAEQAGVLGFSE